MPFPDVTSSPANASQSPMLWDVFCRVIDNFGDIGVCWRLCADLAHRGHTVRLWVDDSSALAWMAPGARDKQWPGVTVLDWNQASDTDFLQHLPPADVWIEGFGCDLATEFIAASAHATGAGGINSPQTPVWVNLEYLSAEGYVERCHALPSPVMQGPAKGWTKHFYYPGFTAGTGGLLREPALPQQPDMSDATRAEWLAAHHVPWAGERLVSLFCYEPAALASTLAAWMQADTPTLLLVTPGRAARAIEAALPTAREQAGPHLRPDALRLHHLPALSHPDFDALLHACDLNLVRGEDSLVRALWAGKPFIWHIYPQDDGAHADKLAAFLDCMGADNTVRQLHAAWNGLPASALGATTLPGGSDWAALPLAPWQAQVHSWRTRLRAQPDLVSTLIGFVQKRR